MPKDKIVFVRLTKAQSKAIDLYVRDRNRRSVTIGRMSRSDAIREAVELLLASNQPMKDPELLSTIFEGDLEHAGIDQ